MTCDMRTMTTGELAEWLTSRASKHLPTHEVGFSDFSDDPATPDYPWQPFIQVPGMCLPLHIWFASKEECDAFIEEHLAGARWTP